MDAHAETVKANIKQKVLEGRFNDKVEPSDPVLSPQERSAELERILARNKTPLLLLFLFMHIIPADSLIINFLIFLIQLIPSKFHTQFIQHTHKNLQITTGITYLERKSICFH